MKDTTRYFLKRAAGTRGLTAEQRASYAKYLRQGNRRAELAASFRKLANQKQRAAARRKLKSKLARLRPIAGRSLASIPE
jgi:hypothetical protein